MSKAAPPQGHGRRMAYLALETPREGQASHTHIHEIISELKRLGWIVDLFATTRGGASSRSRYMDRLMDYCRVQMRLAAKVKSFDVLYIRSHFMALPLALLARAAGLVVVHEINGKPADFAVTYPRLGWLSGLVTWLYKRQYRVANWLLPVTDGLAAWVKDFAGHDRVLTVPNAANTRVFTPDGPRFDAGYTYCVFVGGLVAWHGIATMVSATREEDWPSQVRLLIIGDGPEREIVSASANNRQVVWLGRQSYDAIPSYLRGALAALCVIEDPSGRSATGVAPLKLFEAMACGCAIIASDLPYQADLVRTTRTGMIIKPGDPRALARSVASLASDQQQAGDMGRRASVYAQANASWEKRAKQIDDTLSAPFAAHTRSAAPCG